MSKKQILIVDDDPYLQIGLSRRLKANSYEVQCAGDAVSAIAEVNREKPDLIILDLGLPGSDGFKVLQNFKSDKGMSSIPVIILSARDPGANRDRAFRSGAVDYLYKPIQNLELLSAVQQALQ